MSLAAETSKTALEIYTPVIVGLGAVILGFLANGLLEVLKDYLRKRAEVRKIRCAIYFELERMVDLWATANSLWDKGEDGEKITFLKFSDFLDNLHPKEISVLEKAEVDAVAEVVTVQDLTVYSVTDFVAQKDNRMIQIKSGENIFGGDVTMTNSLKDLVDVGETARMQLAERL